MTDVEAPLVEPATEAPPALAADAEKKSAATTLVEIAQRLYTLGCTPDGETFAVPVSGPRVAVTLRGNRQSLRGQLAREYFKTTGRAAPQQALADALLVVEGFAQECAPEALHLRVAERGGATWLDLGDASGLAVRVDASGWEIAAPPVLFKRTALSGELPTPERGGTLGALWQFLNVGEDDRPLVLAWLVAALYPDIAHPVLAVLGEQGAGKSTALRLLVDCIDASPVPLRKPPRDADSWVTAAAGSWVVSLDNLSDIPGWLSDSICRAVTGDGDVRRKLYTDGDHAVFAYRRVVALNGIDVGAVRGDLGERMLPITLQPIQGAARLCDADIWPQWEAARPRVLGAILDAAAGVAGMIPFVRLESKPRMADYSRIVAAVDAVLKTDGLRTYSGKQGALALDTLSGDAVFAAIAEHCGHGFTGTAADLFTLINPERPPRGWPTDARAVTQRLRRLAPVMRKAGWRVSDDGAANHAKVIVWSIEPPGRPEIARISSPQPPQSPQRAGVAGVAGGEYGESQDGCPRCATEGCAWCRR
ncbi:MAG: ATP-binding protein [Pseudomonadales bacterium]|nr:ATP-binding protein [Pseudomonadales bacterium]